MTKIAIITCYKDPDYIRSRVLRSAVSSIEGIELIIIKNKHKSVLRYIEVPIKTLLVRLISKPQIYLLTFRGYEIFPITRILTLGKSLYYDEFINLEEWLVFEHKKINQNSIAHKLIHSIYKLLLSSVNLILTDTQQHAKYSSKLMNIPYEKYKAIPVGTDESIFTPTAYKPVTGRQLEVFYYGSMLPLHGLAYVLESAINLKNLPIHFTIIGGNKQTFKEVEKCISDGASITYLPRVPFESIANYIADSDVCLGGPFGDTIQSRMVITGKTYQFLASQRITVIGFIPGEDIFKDKVNCLIVRQGSALDLSAALEWAYNNPSHLERVARNGRILYEKSLSVDRIKDELRRIIP